MKDIVRAIEKGSKEVKINQLYWYGTKRISEFCVIRSNVVNTPTKSAIWNEFSEQHQHQSIKKHQLI